MSWLTVYNFNSHVKERSKANKSQVWAQSTQWAANSRVTDLRTPVCPGHKCVQPCSSTRSCRQCCDRSLVCTPPHQTACTHLHLQGDDTWLAATCSLSSATLFATGWWTPTCVGVSCQLPIGHIFTADVTLPRRTHLVELVWKRRQVEVEQDWVSLCTQHLILDLSSCHFVDLIIGTLYYKHITGIINTKCNYKWCYWHEYSLACHLEAQSFFWLIKLKF